MMRKGKAPLPLVADEDGKTLGILMLTDFGIAENYRHRGELNRIDSLKRTEEKECLYSNNNVSVKSLQIF